MKLSNCWRLLFVVCMVLIQSGPLWAAAPEKLVILPFNINAEKDLSFLKNGVQDMLASRLTNIGKTEPVKKEAVMDAVKGISKFDEKQAARIGEKFNAAYVIFGSLTVFGESVSTDAKVFDTKQKSIVMTFSKSGRDSGDVITHINQFAAQVNEHLLGNPKKQAVQAADAGVLKTDESRRNPESLWNGRVEAERKGGTVGGGAENLGTIWRSRHIKNEIRGIAVADVDGDGLNEVVMADDKNILIYRLANERFAKVGEFRGQINEEIIGIDAADINGSGKAQIFVSNLQKSLNRLRSFVLEWDGAEFQKIVSDDQRYYRVLKAAGRAPMLIGQSRSRKRIFLPAIDELMWSDGKYITAGPVAGIPAGANVFNFNIGDVTGTGRASAVVFSKSGYLQVLDQDIVKDWESSEPYLPGAVYLEYEDEATARIGEYKEKSNFYLPQRILITDTDGDGKNEVLVCKNKDAAKGLFERLRIFKSGQIECLAWDKLGLHPKWRTREISGYVSDFQVDDIDNDGRNELVFSVIKQKDSVVSEPRSYIVAQEIVQ